MPREIAEQIVELNTNIKKYSRENALNPDSFEQFSQLKDQKKRLIKEWRNRGVQALPIDNSDISDSTESIESIESTTS